MMVFKLISKQPLDVGILVGRFRDIGNAYLRSGVLTIDNRNGACFWIDPIAIEDPFKDYTAEQLVRIRALVGQPVVTLLGSDTSEMTNVAFSRLPSERIFVENAYRVIFAIEEVQRRLGAGEDWESVGK